jgi:surface protein
MNLSELISKEFTGVGKPPATDFIPNPYIGLRYTSENNTRYRISAIDDEGTIEWTNVSCLCPKIPSKYDDTIPNLTALTYQTAIVKLAREVKKLEEELNNPTSEPEPTPEVIEVDIIMLRDMVDKASAVDWTDPILNNKIIYADISKMDNLDNVFSDAAGWTNFNSNFNLDISGWDTSNITSMDSLFQGQMKFNQDLSNWNVSKVTSMSSMFAFNWLFDQNISNWNVSNVTNMYWMFTNAAIFNQDISSWDVSNVNNMDSMFYGTEKFNQDISNWDVSKVTNMYIMFYGALAFNQDISVWNVNKVTKYDNFVGNGSLLEQYPEKQPKFN